MEQNYFVIYCHTKLERVYFLNFGTNLEEATRVAKDLDGEVFCGDWVNRNKKRKQENNNAN